MAEEYLSDRSRTLTYQICPRKRLLAYELLGTGIQRVKMDVRAATGTYIHRGIQLLLMTGNVEAAANGAAGEYMIEVSKRGLELDPIEDVYEVATEQEALIKQAVRGFARQRLTDLLAEFKIIGVEREGVLPLAPGIEYQFRVDAEMVPVRTTEAERELVILSIKTVDYLDKERLVQDLHAMQGIADSYCLRWDTGLPARLHFEYIVLGQRRRNKQTGRREQNSPLIRGYFHEVGRRFAAMREYQDGRGSWKKLGNEWKPYVIWNKNKPGLCEWIDFLAEHNILRELFIAADLNAPTDGELSAWKYSTVTQESGVKISVPKVVSKLPVVNDVLADALFPMYRHSCDFPRVCEFQEICYGAVSIDDPLKEGLYQPRTPNHARERKEKTNA